MSPLPFSTAWSTTAAGLAAQLQEAAVDHDAFARPLRACDLQRCRATCCHDGVHLSPEEAEGIRRLCEEGDIPHRPDILTANRRAYPAYPPLPENPLLPAPNLKTATRPAGPDECAADHPGHFPRTRCVFLDEASRCTLQLLSVAAGHHPWHWKPLTCWLHPLVLLPASSQRPRPVLTLHTPETDPQQAPGYPGFASCTHCGRPEPGGRPAHEILEPELRALSTLSGRDFLRELRAPPAP